MIWIDEVLEVVRCARAVAECTHDRVGIAPGGALCGDCGAVKISGASWLAPRLVGELGVALQEGAFKVLAKKALHRGGELIELVDLFTEKKPPSSKAKPKA